MKLLWIKTDFLHPTTKGGHIRTLEMLKRLHRRHEIHYVAFADSAHPEQVALASEYSSHAYPIAFKAPEKRSPRFMLELVAGLFSRIPVACRRWRSAAMQQTVDRLLAAEKFDGVVCDFLFPALNLSQIDQAVLFQHNVEASIWRRHEEHAQGALRRTYFGGQARKMFAYEREVCQKVRGVIAVSEIDARLMEEWFGLSNVPSIPTGVDTDYFEPQPSSEASDLVFVGSMDWLPNIDGVTWFIRDVLPLIRAVRPGCTFTIVGRAPTPEITAFAEADRQISVTGTVPDIRPYLWGAHASIVPLRIGGGTRLKIYEAMAAGVPVVSTTVGAEGLTINPPTDIRLADDAASFAEACLDLLSHADVRSRMAVAARQLVVDQFSWEKVTDRFERALRDSLPR